MKNLLYLILLSPFLFSCNQSKYKFWDVNKFNLAPDALADSQEIKLIYCSRGPNIPMDFDEDVNGMTRTISGDSAVDDEPFVVLDYYIQYVVFEPKSGDTFNILTSVAIELKQEDRDLSFIYSKEPSIQVIISHYTDDLESLIDKDISSLKMPSFNKVARDPKYDYDEVLPIL